MAHDVSLSYSRSKRMPPAAVALAILLHALVVLAFTWKPVERDYQAAVDPIDVTVEQALPAPVPAETPAAPPPPPAASQAPAPSPAPPVPLGLPPPAPSPNAEGAPGVETPAPRTTDAPTPEPARSEEAKPGPPEPPPQQQALAPSEPAPPPPPPPPQAPPPQLEQVLPPLEAPPPPLTAREIPKPVPAPQQPAPQQPAQRTAPPPQRPTPPAPPPRPAPPLPPPPPQQALRPSPLNQPQQRPADRQSAAQQPSATFHNPADTYGQKRAEEQYLWQVMRRISQFPYIPKNTTTIREEGTVLTRVTIARDGQLLNVVMERSSGLPSLDAGVLDTIRRASPYPVLPADISGNSHTFQLPVSFRYNEQR